MPARPAACHRYSRTILPNAHLAPHPTPTPLQPVPGLEVVAYPAGHALGGAMFLVKAGGTSVLYTGEVYVGSTMGREGEPQVTAAEPPPPRARCPQVGRPQQGNNHWSGAASGRGGSDMRAV